MKRIFTGVLALVASPGICKAEDWVVRKNAGNQNCYVQAATGLGNYAPTVISKHANRKEACEAAKALKVDEDENGKCPTYNVNTISECAKDGVKLK